MHCLHQSFNITSRMKIIIISALATLSIAAPQYNYSPPPTHRHSSSIYYSTSSSTTPSQLYAAPGAGQRNAEVKIPPPVAILRDERTQSEDGTFKFEFEGDNGIVVSGSGSATERKQTVRSYRREVTRFQPQSDSLPKAPEFPHPIPQFVLDQIAFAAKEDAAAAGSATAETKSSSPNLYQTPQA
ncbi:uncharacterized protein LOC135206588 [Macrobrachium nipponense]|uniref:uncharacterized protein LOC135206588 n=1 Tax=Macrobrachium nipponense TaxID=159736 RepID=UPI0030C84E1A